MFIQRGPGPDDTPLGDDLARQEQIRNEWMERPAKDLLDEIIRLRIDLERYQQQLNQMNSGNSFNPNR